MAKTTVSDTVVIVDDEPHNLIWLFDYLDSKGLNCLFSTNVNEAIDTINSEIYRALVIDLNIPVLPPHDQAVAMKGDVYATFPGLFVAHAARNRGYRDRQVLIYSVHKDPAVAAEAEKLGCTYILKGRPKEIKQEIDAVISFDPTIPAT